MTTTPTTRPIEVLLNAAKAVSDTEVRLQDSADRVRRIAESILTNVYSGRSVNSLGELQSSAPAVDVACALLEQTAQTFRSAYRYLSPALQAGSEGDENPDPYLVQWFDRTVQGSPRLQVEIARLTQEAEAR